MHFIEVSLHIIVYTVRGKLPTDRTAHRIVYLIISHHPRKIKSKYVYTTQKSTASEITVKSDGFRPYSGIHCGNRRRKKTRIKHICAMHVTIPPPHEYNAWTDFHSEYGKPLDRVRQTPAKKRRNTGLRIMPTSETVKQYHSSHPNPFNCI